MGTTKRERAAEYPRPYIAGHALRASDCLSEVVRLLSSCAQRVEAGHAEDAQCCVEQFRAAIHVLLERHLGQHSELAARAYDLGVATGFHGSEAAAVVTQRQAYEALLAEASQGGRPWRDALAAELLRAGYLHGRDIKAWAQRD